MKNYILLIIMLIALAACQPTPQSQDDPATPQQTEPAVKSAEEFVKETVPSQLTNDAQVQKLLERHKTVKSISYWPDEATQTNEVDLVYVKGDKLRKYYGEPRGRYTPETYISDIYIDRAAKTAVGTCDLEQACTADRQPVTLDFEEENVRTPLDIISKVGYAEKVDKVFYDRREVTRLRTTLDGQDTLIWVDDYSGIPLQIEVYDAQGEVVERHTYTQLSTNSVSDNDVMSP